MFTCSNGPRLTQPIRVKYALLSMYQCERRMFLRYLAKETSDTGVERTALPLVRAWNVSASWSNSDSSEAPPNRPPIIIVRLHLAGRFPGMRLEGIGTCLVNVCVCGSPCISERDKLTNIRFTRNVTKLSKSTPEQYLPLQSRIECTTRPNQIHADLN